MIDEQKIRSIVQQEIQNASNRSRFTLQTPQLHAHTGNDGSPQVKQTDIVPSTSVSGSITFDQVAIYTLNLNSSFTPSRVTALGNVTGPGGIKVMTVGEARLTPSFYFQPSSLTSVITGNIQYPFQGQTPAQSSVYLYTQPNALAGGVFHTLVSEFHIVDVSGFPTGADIYARATIVGFSKNAVLVEVSDLTAGWEMNINYIIT